MTPLQSRLPSIFGCICRDEHCLIPRGKCHCGCGKDTPIAKKTRKERGDVRGYPHKYILGHTRNVGHRPFLPAGMCVCRDPNCTIPFGFCHCGCGQKTNIAPNSDTKSYWIKGLPIPFLLGHHRREIPIAEDAAPFKINGFYCRLIPLTQGLHVIIWEADYKYLMHWKWFAVWDENARSFYAGRQIREKKGKQYTQYMHRQLLGLGKGDKRLGDHANGNTLDCRRDNLRYAGYDGNARNRKKQRNNTSGFKGVSLDRDTGLYSANIRVNGVLIYLGRRGSARLAHELYCFASKSLHGEFSRVQ